MSEMTPEQFRRLGSSLTLLFVFGQILDAITTQVGLRMGLFESNPDSSAILHAAGPVGLVVEKAVIVVSALLFRRFQNPRWARMSYVESVIRVVGIGLISFASVFFPFTNAGWIVAKALGLV